jgi:tripartite-type tricarboxylate transporter receptor subunit TctC
MVGFRGRNRLVAAVFCLLIAACAATSARAEDRYPKRPITIIVPFAAGGPTDILARLISQTIGPMLGQQVVVEDVTGAGGTIGATRAARADPDGYTMVMGNLGTHAASVGMYAKLPYDPRTDFEPVVLVATTPMVLVTRKSLPVHTLDEVVAYAKAHPGKTTMGSAGIGSITSPAPVSSMFPIADCRRPSMICSAARSICCSTRSSRRPPTSSTTAKMPSS